MHASAHAYTILVFLLAFFYKFGAIDQAQIAEASLAQVEVYTCRSNSTPNRIIWVCSPSLRNSISYNCSLTYLFN